MFTNEPSMNFTVSSPGSETKSVSGFKSYKGFTKQSDKIKDFGG